MAIDFTRRESRWSRELKSSSGVLLVERASMWSRFSVMDESESDTDPINDSETGSDSGWNEVGEAEGRE